MFEYFRKPKPEMSDAEKARLAAKTFIAVADEHSSSVPHQILATAIALYRKPYLDFGDLASTLRHDPKQLLYVKQAAERTHAKIRRQIEERTGKPLADNEGPPAVVTTRRIKAVSFTVFDVAGELVFMRKGVLKRALRVATPTMDAQKARVAELQNMARIYRYRRLRYMFR